MPDYVKARDYFEQADVALTSAPWQSGYTFGGPALDSLNIVSGRVRPNVVNNDSIAVYTAQRFTDQWAQCTIKTISSAFINAPRIILRANAPGALTCYQFMAITNQPGQTSTIAKCTGGVYTNILSEAVTTWVAGDIIKGTAVGNLLTLYRNGVQLLQTTDSDHTAGYTGMLTYVGTGAAVSDSELDDFQAGEFFDVMGQRVQPFMYGPGKKPWLKTFPQPKVWSSQSIRFRKTLSGIGTRTGSRQTHNS